MTTAGSPSTEATTPPRPLLLWHSEREESHIEPTLESAAQFLKASPEDVLAAINDGEPLDDWFIDWQVSDAD